MEIGAAVVAIMYAVERATVVASVVGEGKVVAAKEALVQVSAEFASSMLKKKFLEDNSQKIALGGSIPEDHSQRINLRGSLLERHFQRKNHRGSVSEDHSQKITLNRTITEDHS